MQFTYKALHPSLELQIVVGPHVLADKAQTGSEVASHTPHELELPTRHAHMTWRFC
jgi:hypothetical protein